MRDLNQAAKLFDEACQKGSLPGCSAHAAMLEAGDIIGRDLPRARALYEKTCAGGIAADCYTLGRLVQKDPNGRKPAFDLFSKGCTGNIPAACHEVAQAWDTGREPMKALPFYQKACTGGVAAACERAKKLQP